MSNHTSTTSPEYITIIADNGLRFTGEVINRYEHQGQAFVDVTILPAHGYPEVFSGGRPVFD